MGRDPQHLCVWRCNDERCALLSLLIEKLDRALVEWWVAPWQGMPDDEDGLEVDPGRGEAQDAGDGGVGRCSRDGKRPLVVHAFI
jgi:hypothetical protein